MRELMLFVPASGPTGSGEYYRCLALARAVRARSPDCECHLLVHREAGVELDPEIPCHLLDDTPTRQTPQVLECIERLEPGLVLFDSAGRLRQLRAARAAGAATVWLSDRPGKRRKGFRWRAMRQLDLHLVAAPGQPQPVLDVRERLMRRLVPATAVEFFSTIAPGADALLAQPWLTSLQVVPGGYLLFVAGGGGYRHDGRPIPELLIDAAGLAHRQCGLPAVVVLGPQYRPGAAGRPAAPVGVQLLDALPTAELGALLACARAAVTGAGSMMVAQGVATGVATVLVPAGGTDQPARIRALSEAGAALAAPLEPPGIAEAVSRLVTEPALAAGLAQAAAATGLRNDVQRVAGLLTRLLDTRRSGRLTE
ncbi:MAG: hypothetical protein EA371_06995 [Gammaproteobacteria bacterium]|nr:MAG: hypothetical protein EA371_06995 [Gammaproteobacteria bacterium]